METDFNYLNYPDKINMGCGWDYKEGYLNIDATDFVKSDLVADIRDLSFLPSSYYEQIFASDVLEHIPRTEFMNALAEWHRLLKPGGSIYIKTTHIINLAEILKWPDYQTPENEEILVQNFFGTQAYVGDFHLCGFTHSYMDYCLRKIGFAKIKMSLSDYWLLTAHGVKTEEKGVPEVIFSYGFYNVENEENGFRWSQSDSEIITHNASKLSLTVEFPKVEKRFPKRLYYSINGGVPVSIKLNSNKPTPVEISLPKERARVKLESNYVYTPHLYDPASADKRKLSFFVYDAKVQ